MGQHFILKSVHAGCDGVSSAHGTGEAEAGGPRQVQAQTARHSEDTVQGA